MMMLAEIPPFVVGLLVALFVIVSVMMMLIVLIQRPQGGGLSEAFGSASGSGHTAFGAKTGDALTYATITIFVVFIGFAVGLNYIVKPPVAAVPASGQVVPGAPTPAGEGAPPATSGESVPAPTSTAPAESPAPAEAPPAESPKD
ncbi:MAG: preprotein translocase subunit SecG [Phycisphaerae bacterium]|nr:preprotein translocase subunit SecG [Phycisphaerae bacterium]